MALLLCGGAVTGPVNRPSPGNILLLYSYGHGGKGVAVFDDGLVSALSSAGVGANQLFFEYLDLERQSADPTYASALRQWLLRKHAGRRFEAIIAVQQPALRFLLDELRDLAPDAPAISVQALPPSEAEVGRRKVLCQLARFDIEGTLKLAMQLFPGTRHLVVVSGASEADRAMAQSVATAAAKWSGTVEVELTSALPLELMLERVATLQPGSIILFTQYNRDPEGRIALAYEVEAMVTQRASAPVFGLYDFNLANGGVGGSVVGVKALGQTTAKTALDLGDGTLRLLKPVTLASTQAVPTIDWDRALRWRADPSRLPAGTTFVNRTPGFWERYWRYVGAAAVVLLLQSFFIAALVVQRWRQARVDKKLHESESRFGTAFRSSPVAMAITSAATERFVEVNDVFLRVSGFRRDEVVNRTADELALFLDPGDRQRLVARVMRDGQASGIEARIRTRDGGYRDVLISMAGIRLLGEPHRLSSIVDISERKQAEAERERLTMAIEQAAETVVITDAHGAIVYANPAFEVTTGYTREEALGQNPRILKSGAHDETFYRALWTTISSGTVWHGRLVNKRKNGQLYTEEASISPVRDAAGLITYFVAVKRDITPDLALEAKLLQSQKMEGIGRLAGGVAHDFNNILSVILSCAAFVLERLPKGDALRSDVLEIEREGRRAADLTRQLLAFSRQQVLQPVPLDLNQVLGEMEKMLRRIIGEDVDLVQVLDPGLWLVTADPGQVEQVVMNLVVNARDAMLQGGQLTIETANVELEAEYVARHAGATAGPHVMVAISDSGVGMDERTQARIFEPFFTTKEVGKGTGLGLSTVYGIVKQSGGSIYVYSEAGRGTTFKVYLPRASPLDKKVDLVPAQVSSAGGHETILIAEDDDAVRAVTVRILEGAGYSVLTAASGGEAELICRRHAQEIQLLLTDVVMPQMSGRALAESLSTLRPGVKVLYMSGYADDAIVHHGVLERGTHFIGKPFTQATLLRKVREVLDAADPEGQSSRV